MTKISLSFSTAFLGSLVLCLFFWWFRNDINLLWNVGVTYIVCKGEDERRCYEEYIRPFMRTSSMEQTFELVSKLQQWDNRYKDCHNLAHAIGREAVQSNPTQWKQVLQQCPQHMCTSGCAHGVFEAAYKKSDLTVEEMPDIALDVAGICMNNNLTISEKMICFHGLGHLAFLIGAADVNKALMFCDLLSEDVSMQKICYGGLFMQLFDESKDKDVAYIQREIPKRGEVRVYCSKFPSAKADECIMGSWPLFVDEIRTPNGLEQFCIREDVQKEMQCVARMVSFLTLDFNFDVKRIVAYCVGLSEEKQETCFTASARRMLEADMNTVQSAVDLCSLAKEYHYGEKCYDALVDMAPYAFLPSSEKFTDFCRMLPDQFMNKCLH